MVLVKVLYASIELALSTNMERSWSRDLLNSLCLLQHLLPLVVRGPLIACARMLSCFSRARLFCNPMDYSPPGSSVHGILQLRILELVAMPSSRESSLPRDWTCISCIAGRLFIHWSTWEAMIAWILPIIRTTSHHMGFSGLNLFFRRFPWEQKTPD